MRSQILVHADVCRSVRYKKPPRETWEVIQCVPLQVARPYYINGRKNTVRSLLGDSCKGVSWLPILPCLPFIPCFRLAVDCRKIAVRSYMPALAPSYCPVRVTRLQSSYCSSYRPVLVTLSVPYSFLSSCIQYRAQPSARVHQALVPALPTY